MTNHAFEIASNVFCAASENIVNRSDIMKKLHKSKEYLIKNTSELINQRTAFTPCMNRQQSPCNDIRRLVKLHGSPVSVVGWSQGEFLHSVN